MPAGPLSSIFKGASDKSTAYPQSDSKNTKKKKQHHTIKPKNNDLFPSGTPMFNLEEHGNNGYEGVVLLGIPANDFSAAEARLLKRMAQLKKIPAAPGRFSTLGNKSAEIGDDASNKVISQIRSQHRAPLPGALPTHPVAPNPNPNSTPAEGAGLLSVIDQFKKKYSPRTPLGRLID